MKKYVVDDIFQHSKEKFYFTKEEITLFEAFAGIGSQHIAMNELAKEFGFKLKVVGISEIDKYAIQSYNAIHGETKNYGSITDIQEIPQVDIFTYSFPCQDISLAGHQKGFTKGSGTRSGLLWEVERLLENQEKISKLPQVLIMENVKSLLSEQFKDDLQEWKDKLESLGYSNFLDVLNAKDYEIPQNRERVFMISILGEYSYFFPIKKKLKLRLKDMLEDEVNEKYYLSDKMLNFFQDNSNKQREKGNGFRFTPQNGNKIAKAITTRNGSRMDDNFIEIPEATKKGYAEASDGDGVYINRPHQKRGVVQKGMIQTIKTTPDIGVVVLNPLKGKTNNGWHFEQQVYDENGITRAVKAGGGSGNIPKVIKNNLRIRKLTPKECWRLMGFSDSDFEKAEKVCSNSQLYKQAGNSIVVNVLYYIFKQLFKKGEIE